MRATSDRHRIAAALVTVGLFASLPWPAPDPVGTATAVDGDSLRLNGTLYRLLAVDAPELGQDAGAAARAYLAHLVRGRPVRCRVIGHGRLGRPLAVCVARETHRSRHRARQGATAGDLTAAMIRAGWARAGEVPRRGRPSGAYTPKADRIRPYAPLETAARADRLGLWAPPHLP